MKLETAVARMFRLLSAVRIEFAFNSSPCGKGIGRNSVMVAIWSLLKWLIAVNTGRTPDFLFGDPWFLL